jgi:hypothetical protein
MEGENMARNYGLGICEYCKQEYEMTGPRQKYCKNCQKVIKRIQERERIRYKREMAKKPKKIDPYFLRRGDPNVIRKYGDVFSQNI